MKDQIRNLLDKGKTENCSSEDEQEMFSLFQRPDIEFEIKETFGQELKKATTEKE